MTNNEFGYIEPTNNNYGKFGLNQGLLGTLTIDKNQDGTNSFLFIAKKGDKEFKRWFSKPKVDTPLYSLDLKKRVEKGEEGHEKAYAEAFRSMRESVQHVAEAITTDTLETFKARFNNVNSFKGWAQAIMSSVKNKETEIDLFLQFQGRIRDGQSVTYLEIPYFVWKGAFVTKTVPGVFKEVINGNGLQYVDENGNLHPFKRGARFMNSKVAHRQSRNQDEVVDINNVTEVDDNESQDDYSWG